MKKGDTVVARRGMKLTYIQPDGTGGLLELTDQPITVGRSQDADIVVADEKVSRIHCGIRLWDGEYYLKDLKSKNGTFVNGQRIDVQTIKPGDVIRVGSATINVGGDGPGPNTIIRQIGSEMEQGKGYSTILREIVHDAEPESEAADPVKPASGSTSSARKPIRVVVRKPQNPAGD